MLNEPVLVDAGALIALFNSNDPLHKAFVGRNERSAVPATHDSAEIEMPELRR